MKYSELKSFVRRAVKKVDQENWDTPLFDAAGLERITKNMDRDIEALWAIIGGRPAEVEKTVKRRAPKKVNNADVPSVL